MMRHDASAVKGGTLLPRKISDAYASDVQNECLTDMRAHDTHFDDGIGAGRASLLFQLHHAGGFGWCGRSAFSRSGYRGARRFALCVDFFPSWKSAVPVTFAVSEGSPHETDVAYANTI
jgi:hypothetical protein